MQHGKAVPAGFLRQGAAEPRLSDAGGPNQQNVLVMAHPIAVGQGPHKFAIQAPGMLIVDIFHDAAFLQAGRAKAVGECAVLFPQPLLVDEQAKALLEGELTHVGVFQLSAEGVGHSVQFHDV
jgi:hypothetical protein